LFLLANRYDRAWALSFACSLDLIVPVDASIVLFHEASMRLCGDY
jgi:hypothetical protein